MDDYLATAWNDQLPLLIGIAALLGLGKGGVPGLATVATALTVATAPPTTGGLAHAVSLQVPILTMIDVAAAVLHRHDLDWSTVKLLLPASYIGMLVGQGLSGTLSDGACRLLVGGVLLAVMGLRVYTDHSCWLDHDKNDYDDDCWKRRHRRKPSDPVVLLVPDEEETQGFLSEQPDSDQATELDDHYDHHIVVIQPPPQQQEQQEQSARKGSPVWGTAVGLIGGVSTILTNSMGPILNFYLLAMVQLSPAAYIGTRAMFFCIVNLGKLPLRIASGTLGVKMLPLATLLGAVSVLAVCCAKPILHAIPKTIFVQLELAVVAVAGIRLCWMGLSS